MLPIYTELNVDQELSFCVCYFSFVNDDKGRRLNELYIDGGLPVMGTSLSAQI